MHFKAFFLHIFNIYKSFQIVQPFYSLHIQLIKQIRFVRKFVKKNFGSLKIFVFLYCILYKQ